MTSRALYVARRMATRDVPQGGRLRMKASMWRSTAHACSLVRRGRFRCLSPRSPRARRVWRGGRWHPRFPLQRHRDRRVGLEIVIPALVFRSAIVARDDRHAVGMRNAGKRGGDGFPALAPVVVRMTVGSTCPGEAAHAAGELSDQLIQAVCGQQEEYAASLRDGHGAHRPINTLASPTERALIAGFNLKSSVNRAASLLSGARRFRYWNARCGSLAADKELPKRRARKSRRIRLRAYPR
jgi:hypothetical protein